MHHFVQGPQIRCSKCQSASFENVTWGNVRFIRCRSCGHESEPEEIIPTAKSDSLITTLYKQSGEQQVQEF